MAKYNNHYNHWKDYYILTAFLSMISWVTMCTIYELDYNARLISNLEEVVYDATLIILILNMFLTLLNIVAVYYRV